MRELKSSHEKRQAVVVYMDLTDEEVNEIKQNYNVLKKLCKDDPSKYLTSAGVALVNEDEGRWESFQKDGKCSKLRKMENNRRGLIIDFTLYNSVIMSEIRRQQFYRRCEKAKSIAMRSKLSHPGPEFSKNAISFHRQIALLGDNFESRRRNGAFGAQRIQNRPLRTGEHDERGVDGPRGRAGVYQEGQ